jgi:ABC-type multidrug transport system ATPase subunit
MTVRIVLRALLRNKLRITSRNAKFWLLTLLPPLVVVCIAAFVIDTQQVLANIGKTTPLRANVTSFFPAQPNVVPFVTAAGNASLLLEQLRARADEARNVTLRADFATGSALRDFYLNDSANGTLSFAAFEPHDVSPARLNVTLWFNRSVETALPRALHWLAASQLLGDSDGGRGFQLRELSVPFGSDTVSLFAQLAPMLISAFAIAISVSSFGIIVVEERQRGLKLQLRMAGVSSVVYWGAHLLLDVAAQAIVTIVCVTLIAASRGLSGVPFAGLLAALLLFAPAASLMVYCVSFVFGDAATAQKWFPPLVNASVMISAPLLVSLYFALQVPAVYALVFLFACLLPPFALFCAFALLVLGQIGPFVAVVCAQLVSVALWGALLAFFDRRSQRPARKSKDAKDVPRWLPAGSTEAPDVRAERLAIDALDAGEAAMRYAVVARGLKRRFLSTGGKGADKHVLAVRGVTFGIERGECFGLLGPNGAGKSTIISLLSGMLEPDAGSMLVNGFDVPKERGAMYRSMGVCPQFDCLWELLSGREHLELFGGVRGMTAAQIAHYENDVCRTLELDDTLMRRRVSKLSGGTRRKLTLSIALMGEPSVVWLDEPTTGMDPLARRSTWRVISKLRSPQRTFILTTHNMEEADAICSRIGIIADGRLRAIGTTQALKAQHGRGLRVDVTANAGDIDAIDAYLGSAFAACTKLNDFGVTRHYQIENEPVSRLFATLERERVRLKVLDFCVAETTLEFVFLSLVSQAERSRDAPADDAEQRASDETEMH